jgi:hypothetical protein
MTRVPSLLSVSVEYFNIDSIIEQSTKSMPGRTYRHYLCNYNVLCK